MNKIYRVVFNETTNTWVAVQETAKAHGKSKSASVGVGGNGTGSLEKAGMGIPRRFASTAIALAMAVTANYAYAGPGIYVNDGQDVNCTNLPDGSNTVPSAIQPNGGTPVTTPLQGIGNVWVPPISYFGVTSTYNPCNSVNTTAGSEKRDTQTNRTLFYGNNNNPADEQNNGSKNLTLGGRLDVNSGIIGVGDRGVNGANATNSIRMGTGTTLDDDNKKLNAIAIGVDTAAKEENAVSIGYKAAATKKDSAAFGQGAEATLENSVALGSGSTTDANAQAISTATIGSVTYGGFAGAAGVAAGDQVSVGSSGNERQIKYVAPGDITASSTDAVNGSQLYSIAKGLQDNSYFKIAADNGTADTVKLTETVKYSGDSNIVTTVKDNEIDFKLADSITVGPSSGGNPVKIDGTAGTVTGLGNKTWNGTPVSGRAATEDQLKAATDTTPLTVANNGKVDVPIVANAGKLATAGDIVNAINNSGFQATAGGNLATGTTTTPTTVKPGQQITFAAGNGLTVKQDIDSTTGNQTYTYVVNAQSVVEDAQLPVVYTNANGDKVYKQTDGSFNTAADGTGTTVAAGDVIASMNNGAGSTSTATKLTNVAPAVLSATSKDAVNGSQLYAANVKVADALGGNSTVDAQGNLTAPQYNLVDGKPSEGKPLKTYNNVGDALTALNTAVTAPLTFGGDSGTAFERKLGSKVNVQGGVTDATKLSSGNIGVVSNGTDTLDVKLAKELSGLTSAQFTDAAGNKTDIGGNGVTVTPVASGKQPVKLTADGLDNGGNKITNVAKPTADTDAANKKYVDGGRTAVQAAANNPVEVSSTQDANGKTTYTVGVKTATLTTNANGVASVPAAGRNNLVTAQNVVDSINAAGWKLQNNGTDKDLVTAGDTVNFINGTGTTVTVDSSGGVSKVKVDINAQNVAETAQLPVVYTNANGDKVYKQTDGSFN
ncbi:MAG: ESPR-type extended signal peptide-containing protein, partial [Neisseria sp.]|nr:ESPR-type extended signal peptide-containing protein [Neisseria sp.]